MSFSLKNISFYYNRGKPDRSGKRRHGILVDELEISPTGVTAIIGHSGSGKTTLLSLLAGFIAPQIDDGGHFTFDGQDISENGIQPGTVSFVFQNPMLLGSGSGLLNILQGQVARSSQMEHPAFGLSSIRTALEKLGLQNADESLAGKKASELSGGQAQRIAILRALSMNPKAILCDEPTSSLDEQNATHAMEALRDWADETGRPVLWVTHNLEHAARFADHFVFISNGRIHRLSEEQQLYLDLQYDGAKADGLDPRNSDVSELERLAVLRDISEQIKPASEKNHPSQQDKAKPDPPITPGRWRFANWVANALSYDDWLGPKIRKANHPRLAPHRLLKTLKDVTGQPVRQNGLWAALLRILCYSRYSFGFVLCVLLAQIAAVEGFGRLAQTYSAAKLQDPSVARIVFEYVVQGGTDAENAPAELFGDSTLPAIRDRIKASLTNPERPSSDLDRVQVYGRRTVSGSSIRFNAPEAGCNRWLTLQTVALNAHDPLVHQIELSNEQDVRGLTRNPTEIIDIAQASATRFDDPVRVAFLDQFFVNALVTRCGHPPDQPIIVEWSAGQGGRTAPIKLEIRGAMSQPPPLYPSQAELIVFEHDFQQAAALQPGFEPGSFDIATAYFPIDGFQTARAIIQEEKYRVRDDSAAAVETLQNVSTLAHQLPPVVVWITLFGCVVLILLVINSILEHNKRVFALFIAHGAGFVDIYWALFRHLLPACVFAVAFVAGYGALMVHFLIPPLPSDLGTTWSFAGVGFSQAVSKLGAAYLVITILAVLIWWCRTKLHLKTYLQE